MAFILNPDDEQNIPGGGGAFAGDSAAGGGAAQPGTGGTQQWTNVQAYLSGNKSNGDKVLNSAAGKVFDTEQSNMDKAYEDASSNLNTTFDNYSAPLTNNNLRQNYMASRPESMTMGGDKEPYKKSMQLLSTSTVPEVTPFTYGLGKEASDWGSALNDDSSFKKKLHQAYSEAGQGGMTPGQWALQDQLDSTNEAIPAARSALKDRFTNINSAIGTNAQKYQTAADSKKNELQTLGINQRKGEDDIAAYEKAINDKVYDANGNLGQSAGKQYSVKDMYDFATSPYAGSYNDNLQKQKNSWLNTISALKKQYRF